MSLFLQFLRLVWLDDAAVKLVFASFVVGAPTVVMGSLCSALVVVTIRMVVVGDCCIARG